jgi:predicted negative regulator of RcsB-dependent stress response
MTQFSTRRFLIEGTVIVVSILLAFGIDAGWESYQAGQEEQAVLQDLHR